MTISPCRYTYLGQEIFIGPLTHAYFANLSAEGPARCPLGPWPRGPGRWRRPARRRAVSFDAPATPLVPNRPPGRVFAKPRPSSNWRLARKRRLSLAGPGWPSPNSGSGPVCSALAARVNCVRPAAPEPRKPRPHTCCVNTGGGWPGSPAASAAHAQVAAVENAGRLGVVFIMSV